MTPRPSVSVAPVVKQVYTMRGIQRHRMYTGIVRLPGDPNVHRCCGRHQKPRGARECGERLARKLWDYRKGVAR